VRVSKTLESGRELALYEVTPGESCVISTSCMLGAAPYGARGECATDAEIALIPRNTFDRLIAEHRPFREEVLQVFADRILQLMELVESIGFQRLDRRLAAALLGKGRRWRHRTRKSRSSSRVARVCQPPAEAVRARRLRASRPRRR